MKIVLIGGHLSPALAVIHKLKDEEVFFIGRKYVFEGDKAVSLEYQEITKLNIPFFSINTARLQRKITFHTFPSLIKFPLGFAQALRTLRKIKPDLVLGFGGYVSIPVIFAASILKIPVVIHEQTLEVGLANKILSKFAKRICVSWPSSLNYFPKAKATLTGLPLKNEVLEAARAQKSNNQTPTIYITGGSSGSHAINLVIKNLLINLLGNYKIIHQTGDARQFNDFENLNQFKNTLDQRLSKNYIVKKFLSPNDSAVTIRDADLVISRSGINTIAELICLNTPAILIPLPFAQSNEQLKNARFLQNLGLAEIIMQGDLDKEILLKTINKIIDHKIDYFLNNNILINDPALQIVEVIKDVAKKTIA